MSHSQETFKECGTQILIATVKLDEQDLWELSELFSLPGKVQFLLHQRFSNFYKLTSNVYRVTKNMFDSNSFTVYFILGLSNGNKK